MAVVLLRASLTNLFPGRLERRVEVPASTVLGAINAIESQCPGFRARVCDSTPAIRRHIRIFVDAELASLGTELGDRSQVEIIPAISGG